MCNVAIPAQFISRYHPPEPVQTRASSLEKPLDQDFSHIILDRSSDRWRCVMRKWFLLFALAALLMPSRAIAQSAFDGTWKIDMNKVDFPKKPDEYLLQNGM